MSQMRKDVFTGRWVIIAETTTVQPSDFHFKQIREGSFATLGRFDVVDFVEADDPKQIEKAAPDLMPTLSRRLFRLLIPSST